MSTFDDFMIGQAVGKNQELDKLRRERDTALAERDELAENGAEIRRVCAELKEDFARIVADRDELRRKLQIATNAWLALRKEGAE